MNLIVSSNCITGGLAASIQAMIPRTHVIPIVLPSVENKEKTHEFIKSLKKADIWVTNDRFELADGIPLKKIIKVPGFVFNAFHPDLIYAKKKSSNELTSQHYNSRIAVWAYTNGILPRDAAKLFNYQSYQSLGYFDYWETSVNLLKRQFEHSNYSVEELHTFLNHIKRRGLFMYSVNHPYSFALVELAKLIVKRLEISPNVMQREIFIPDVLTDTIWPVYPEIGDELAIEGNYFWRMANVEIEGVEHYLEFAYYSYEKQRILPNDLIPAHEVTNQEIDTILGDQL